MKTKERTTEMKTKAATKSKKRQVKLQDIKPEKNPKGGGWTNRNTDFNDPR